MPGKRIIRTIEGTKVTLTEKESGKSVAVDLSELSPETVQNLALHGLQAKVGDSAASPNKDAIAVMSNVIERLKVGEWNARRAGGGEPSTTLRDEAIARVTGKTPAEVHAALATRTADEIKGFLANEQVKLEMEKIRAERATARLKEKQKAAKNKTFEALVL